MEFFQYQNHISVLFLILFLGLSIRTALWHLKNWQLREYRWDRMKSYIQTKDGRKDLFNLWFFKGILPRPKFSSRILIIILFSSLFILSVAGMFFYLWTLSLNNLGLTSCFKGFQEHLWECEIENPILLMAFGIFIIERILGFIITLAVTLSSVPVLIQKKRIYHRARNVINNETDIIRIGITGSYGKSSTKEILVHLLEKSLGKENVLYNPANNNNEVAIARLILEKTSFFKTQDSKSKIPRVAIFEIGAYRRGEIKTVCRFVQPHIGILTGLNEQHIELFGSQENISNAKFELAEAATKNVFFNADNELLSNIFDQRKLSSMVIPLSEKLTQNRKAYPNKTEFEWRGETCVLPWGGGFFVTNALLALETAHKVFTISPKKLAQSLATLPQLKRALNIQNLKSGAVLLKDIYSANPDGVIGAIRHLAQFKGRKVFVGIPLRELGTQAESAHEKIFEILHEIGAQVFWLKEDFSERGKNICGNNFHLISDDFSHITTTIKSLSKEDAVLLESRLPDKLLKDFNQF